MTGLILHCKRFSFRDIENSTKPEGISLVINDRELSEGTYQDKVVILSCMENGDTETEVRKAVDHATHMIHEWHHGNNHVLVLPFAHLSSNIAMPPTSNDLIQSFVHLLKERGNETELITFGSHKEWMVDVYGYPRATSWFQFRAPDVPHAAP